MKKEILNYYYCLEQVILGQNTIRKGIYTITELNHVSITNRVQKALVTAEWKPDESIDSSLSVIVQLSTLFNANSSGPKDIDPNALRDAIIRVNKVERFEYPFKGKNSTTIKVDWEIVDWLDENIAPPANSKVPPTNNPAPAYFDSLDEDELFLSSEDI